MKRREIILTGITLFAGLFFGWLFFHTPGNETMHNHDDISTGSETIYTCSMHPQIRQNKPGQCPICGMDLIPLNATRPESGNADPDEIQMSESAMALASVQTTIVKRGVPEMNIQLLGKVKADERNISQLTARFGGRIEKLYINYTGQHVQKGEKLGTIYSPDLINAQKELLEATKYRSSNPSFYQASRTKLKLWELTEDQIAAIENSGEPITNFEILSPITGTVTKRHVAIGDYVKEGALLFEVIDLSVVWVMFDAYESDLPWIDIGDIIEFTIKSVPGKIYSGNVSNIDPYIDPQTRVAGVRIEMNNPGLKLKPEMFASGLLISRFAENAGELLIPKSAILWTGKRAVVYIKVPDRENAAFIYREVVLGPEAGNDYVVSEGLEEGEEIAVNGVFRIDASAQLAGKQSMMNPESRKVPMGHDHGSMGSIDERSEQADLTTQADNTRHEEFKVFGNCSMCKDRIEETAMSLDGVKSAVWSEETDMIQVDYNPDITDLARLHKAIAAVGHDTELEKAPDEVYENLPACCKYERN